jgi:hypothetical protein
MGFRLSFSMLAAVPFTTGAKGDDGTTSGPTMFEAPL